MSDTEIRMMRYTIEQLSAELQATKQYVSDIETKLDRTRKALDVALCSLQDIAESDGDFITGSSTTLDVHEYAEMMLDKIKTALEQKEK